jgi:hypothetical protein
MLGVHGGGYDYDLWAWHENCDAFCGDPQSAPWWWDEESNPCPEVEDPWEPPPGGGGGGGGGGGATAPAPWSQFLWDQLSPGEKDLVTSSPAKWWNRRHVMKAARDSAIKWSREKLGMLPSEQEVDGTQQNAWQHALWVAEMARVLAAFEVGEGKSPAQARVNGKADAIAWATAHEDRPNNPVNSMNMDLQ